MESQRPCPAQGRSSTVHTTKQDRHPTVSETHFTTKTHFQIPQYNNYFTNHPDGTAHAGTAILVKQKIQHYGLSLWTYGLELWGCASKSNIAIIQRFQSKLLRATVNVPCYITNAMIHSDLGIPTVQDVIHKGSNKHRAKLQSHPNPLLQSLSRDSIPRRLKRRRPTDL
jgi:hypothetical protein